MYLAPEPLSHDEEEEEDECEDISDPIFEQDAPAPSRSFRGELAELYYYAAQSSCPLTEENLLRFDKGILQSDEIEVSNPINQHDPTIIELAKYLGAEAAHEAWDSIVFATPAIIVIPTRIALGDTLSNKEDTWTNQIVPKVHGAIDEFFEQNISFGDKQRAAERFDTETPPLPFFVIGKIANASQQIVSSVFRKLAASGTSLLEKSVLSRILPSPTPTKEIGKIARIAEGRFIVTEELSLTHKNADAFEALHLEKAALSDISAQANVIWELNGKNIKQLNILKELNENKLNHVFEKTEHNLNKFPVDPEIILKKITNAIVEADNAGQIPIDKPFRIHVSVDGHLIEARGIVIDGQLRYGTFFIPKDGK